MPIDKPDSRTTLRLYERIEELERHLAKANSQAEDFERKWYLATDRIEELESENAELRWERDLLKCDQEAGLEQLADLEPVGGSRENQGPTQRQWAEYMEDVQWQ